MSISIIYGLSVTTNILQVCDILSSIYIFFRSLYGLGFDSASNRNEYHEYFLGVKAAVA